ncbi:hypothetical protein BR93DRAFT_697423 [Coniochaeta sp. PMI_546]|nr:hypothetical protein BR93DRAFT_697423 [Coniochaeta sp. PMI_546]
MLSQHHENALTDIITFRRHDQSLTASAFDIHEIYSVVPSSQSDFVVDLVPDALSYPIVDGCDTPVSELILPTASTWSSNPSVTLPLERYRRDSQRHERVAVSVALGRACDLAVSDAAPVFRRSPAPSPSTGQGLELHVGHHEDDASRGTVGDAITVQSVVDPDEHDYQSLLRTYSLERWFVSSMERTQELAVGLQQTAARLPRPTTIIHQNSTPAPVTEATGGETDHNSPTQSSISLGHIEPDPTLDTNHNDNIDESIQAVKRSGFRLLVLPPNPFLTATKSNLPFHRYVLTLVPIQSS